VFPCIILNVINTVINTLQSIMNTMHLLWMMIAPWNTNKRMLILSCVAQWVWVTNDTIYINVFAIWACRTLIWTRNFTALCEMKCCVGVCLNTCEVAVELVTLLGCTLFTLAMWHVMPSKTLLIVTELVHCIIALLVQCIWELSNKQV
jgi:hypothetical protein